MPQFTLDPAIDADTIAVIELGLSAVRLMRDANYPWLVLVPRRDGLSEIVDLSPEEQVELVAEIAAVSAALRDTVDCDKLNVANLGMMVRQLHVHIIARTAGDPAWPKPVWGAVPAKPYPPGGAGALAAELRSALAERTGKGPRVA